MNDLRLRKKLYQDLLRLLYKSNSHHVGCCLSCMDILIQIFLYERTSSDIVELSKGHAAPVLYVILHHLGKISVKDLMTFGQDGTKLPIHPPQTYYRKDIPIPTGSLGHGLSVSCGIAHAMQLKRKNTAGLGYVYCVMSDGECNEGQVWEAAQYASYFRLHNLIVLIDKNRLQGFGKTKDVLGNPTSLSKWKAFGFNTFGVDGHDLRAIHNAVKKSKMTPNKRPSVIVCNTVKGYGVSFMEDRFEWHYQQMSEEQYKEAVRDIQTNL